MVAARARANMACASSRSLAVIPPAIEGAVMNV
jgi:hypothetical protein